MSALDPIVNITISADGTPLTRTGFGTLAIVCAQADAALAVNSYTSLAAVATAYGTDSPKYRAARAAFSQDPRPPKIKFIDTTLALAQSVSFSVDAATDGTVTSITVYYPDGTSATFTHTASSDTTSTIATELATTISSGSTVVSATALNEVITITNDTDGDLCFFTADSNLDTFVDNTADPGYAAQLTAALALDSDWYGVCADCTSQAVGTAIAGWAEANDRLAIIGNSDAIELTASGDFGAAMVTADYDRTAGIWHSQPKEYAHVAWAAARLVDPEINRKTWAFAELSAVTVDTLNSTERGYLAGDRWNFFVSMAGKNIVLGDASSLPGGGYTFGGGWIDETHGDDWIRTRVQEDIASLIINAGIILYDQAGINAIADVLLKRLRYAEKLGILTAGSSSVDIPQIADVLAADRSARTLNDLAASAQRASAIHKVANVNIALSY